MSEKILAVNAGSSSLKFKLFAMPEEVELFQGAADRITGPGEGEFSYKKAGGEKVKLSLNMPDHEVAISKLLEVLVESGAVTDVEEIKGAGHRVVQGGEFFKDSALSTPENLEVIESLNSLAPLHNPANVMGVRAFLKALPNATQVLVFDTVFHQTMPEVNYLYPIERKFYDRYKIRRYGAHGTSHKYVSEATAGVLGKDLSDTSVVVAHLGNGASITEVVAGKSMNTSMGFTPTGGLIMGTRTGDIDPTVITYLQKITGLDADGMSDLVTKQSGMLAATGFSNDMRDVEEAVADDKHPHHAQAVVSFDMFIKRIADFITLYAADVVAGGRNVDAISFTAGIGENSSTVRKLVVDRLAILGAKIDEVANNTRGTVDITAENSKVKILVIPTEEELMIARDTVRLRG
ncbi:MAG: acetate kinase [Candidatus Ancillula trichonymphae]|jgi:acetate kinase|nr:acetate kinase [Candidatus Ancillula trichonymphae]